jgi:glycosyltransferase involved in cell wall biosynthesis
MNNAQSISIALAVYNGEKYLKELLASLESQTLRPVELVVVDDCSSDNSLDIIQTHSLPFEKKIYVNQQNKGPIYTFKKATELCKGDFIAFCDQDDVWLPQKLELSFNKIKEIDNDIPGVAFSDLVVIDEKGNIIQHSFWKRMAIIPDTFSFKDILFANIVTGCASLINKRMAAELLKMPLNVIMYDHWMALIAYSFGSYAYIKEPTVLFRLHTQNVTKKEKHSLVKVFFYDYKNKANYLKENIEQANSFKRMYANVLDEKQKRHLEKFMDLNNKSFFQKRFIKYVRSLVRKFK